jgi:hypothetical protein
MGSSFSMEFLDGVLYIRVTYLHGGWAWSITTFKVF